MKVTNMTSSNGNAVPNQFTIQDDAGNRYFRSYDSIIVKIPAWVGEEKPKTILDATHWNHSRTTGKYRNQFLGEEIAETRKKIKSGEYILADLNSDKCRSPMMEILSAV